MAIENFTTYTETDPGAKLTVTASKITFADKKGTDGLTTVTKDYGAAHFGEDFEHLYTVLIDELPAGVGVWTSRMLNDPYDNNALGVMILRSGGNPIFQIIEIWNTTSYTDPSSTFSLSTLYYYKFKRVESVGTYGTLYDYIYTDEARTSLFDTVSLTLHGKADFETLTMFYGGASASTADLSGYVEDLDLQGSTAQAVGGGSVSIAAAVSKTTKKGLSGAVTIASTLGRTIKKGVAGTVTIAASLGRKISKAVGDGSAAIAGALSYATLVRQTVGDGAVAVASALNLIVKLGLSGAVTQAATLGRKVSTSLSGAITPSGALSSKTKLEIGDGSIAISSTLVLLIKKGVSGTVTIAATLGRKVYKAVSGVIAPVGTVGRKIFKGLGDGTVTPASTLGLKIKLAVGSGSITAVGALAINLLRKLSAFISFKHYRTVSLDFKPYRDIDLTIRGG